jgi:hypothetical protein
MSSEQPSPRAAPMAGDGAYNRAARTQSALADTTVPLLVAAARRVPLAEQGALVLADYGCSQGINSLAPMRAAITAMRERASESRPICVVHNDQPGNDFSSLFRLLEEDPASYLRDDPNVFPLAVGRSFFQRVLPPSSVTLGWCASAAMWLSRVPSAVPDAWHPAFTSIPDVRAAYKRQSAEDWRMFLTHRAAELAPGGRLVILLVAYADDGARGAEPLVWHMHAERDALLEAGIISPDQSRRMIVPLLGRSRDDLLAPFNASGSFEGLEIEHLEIFVAPDPIWEDFKADGNSEAFGRRWAASFRAAWAPSLASSLPPDQADVFIHRMEAGLASRLAKDPSPMTIWCAHVVVARLAK